MSYRESTSKIAIEPYCIFCGEPTVNVETSVRVDRTSSSGSVWGRTGRIITTETTTTTRSIPFPAHSQCREEIERANSVSGKILLGLVIVSIGIGLFMALYFHNLGNGIVACLGAGMPMLAAYIYFFQKLPSVRGSAERYAETHKIEESAG